jgi:hypothetical protein
MILFASILILYPTVFFLRGKYILKEDRLVVKQFFKTNEITYASIKQVVEVIDGRMLNPPILTGRITSPEQIWIWFTDRNGREEKVILTPAKKQDFLAGLISRIPNPRVFETDDRILEKCFPNKVGTATWTTKKSIVYSVLLVLLLVLLFLFKTYIRIHL